MATSSASGASPPTREQFEVDRLSTAVEAAAAKDGAAAAKLELALSLQATLTIPSETITDLRANAEEAHDEHARIRDEYVSAQQCLQKCIDSVLHEHPPAPTALWKPKLTPPPFSGMGSDYLLWKERVRAFW